MPIEVREKGQAVAIDFCGPLPTARGGLNLILVVMDVYTRYTRLFPLRKAGTENAIKAIEAFIQDFGSITALISDNQPASALNYGQTTGGNEKLKYVT